MTRTVTREAPPPHQLVAPWGAGGNAAASLEDARLVTVFIEASSVWAKVVSRSRKGFSQSKKLHMNNIQEVPPIERSQRKIGSDLWKIGLYRGLE